jgi:hypothetical protein
MQSLLCKLYLPADVLNPVSVIIWWIKANDTGGAFRMHRREEKYV